MILPVYGYPALLHRLKKRSLRFGRGTVYFIGKKQLTHYGSGTKAALSGVGIIHRKPQYVGRQHIRRALYPAKIHIKRGREGVYGSGFSNTRHILQKRMSPAQQAAQQQPCALFLAHHRSCNIIRYFPGGIRTKIHFFPCKLHGLKFPVLLYMFP